ncbi:anthranilate synthase component I [Pectinatus sottacetonis]|uniref:anthranilate synthase component I n=1 Tax=Pectinatus sottacetonis TaxID=1002795 RepID=UPI0018C6F8BE|nr:anthranilate synthase component I [Pectinatus sottacetonis]
MVTYKPDLKTLEKMTNEYKILPVSRELFSDMKTPIEILRAVKSVSDCCFLLESVEGGAQWGRYSFLGFNPSLEVKCKNHQMTIKNNDGIKTFHTDEPSMELRQILKDYKSPRFDFLPPLTGGLIGYFAYEYIRYSEKKLDFAGKKQELNDVDLMLFDKIIAFDNLKQKIFLIVNIRTDDLEKNYEQARKDIDELADLVLHGKICREKSGRLMSPFKSELSEMEYETLVRKTKEYIKEGDIFQAVPSNRREAAFTGSLLNAYRMLRTTNPSPYMFYFSGREIELTGASPETLVKLKDGRLSTFPIAGTMPRGKTLDEDKKLEEKLSHDEKELAEHNMLVDLGRNDLGKVSEFGTVKVTDFHKIERFSHVMHIASTVTGHIRKDKDALDAIEATLPAGTLSGAPKVRAVEILHELEKSMRGIYGGAIGYIDFTGNMDVCIGIRMAVAHDNKVYVRSGGGIVYDSVPRNEYMETQNKAGAMMEAIEKAQEVED